MPTTIESDENIEFKPTSAKADSLDGSTIADKKNSYVMLGDNVIDSVRIIPGRMASGLVDSVWNAYASLVSLCKDEVPHFLNDERLKSLVAGYLGISYWVRQEREDDNGKPGITTTPPSEVHAVDLVNFLRATYGDYFTQTDFGQELSAQGDAKVALAGYTAKFPEVNALAHSTVSRELSTGKVVANPYLLVMHAAPEFRVALAGAIYIAEQNGEFKDVDFNAPVNVSPACHPKPSFKSLLQFAEMLGIRDLKPLMEELEKIPHIQYITPQQSSSLGGIGYNGVALPSVAQIMAQIDKSLKEKKTLEEQINELNPLTVERNLIDIIKEEYILNPEKENKNIYTLIKPKKQTEE